MKLALAQLRYQGSRERTLADGLSAIADAAGQGADLIAFPELSFTEFFPQHPAGPDALELAEPVPGPTTERLQEAASTHNIVVLANLYERVGGKAYDTTPAIDADGTLLGRTRMMHITDYEGFHEQGYYTPGDTGAPVYDTDAGRVGVCICYDRHYPEYLRALALQKPDLVVVPQAGVVSEWPEGLFESEMQIASFQNGFFSALVNRVGEEDELTFGGGSFVCNPEGRVIARATEDEAELLIAEIDPAVCQRSHARRLFLRDRRPDVYYNGLIPGTIEQPSKENPQAR